MPLFLLIRHGENDFVKTGKLARRWFAISVNHRLHGMQTIVCYKEFLKANPDFYEKTRQRAFSYWDCYYRQELRS